MMKRIYISAPISGYDLTERRRLFSNVEAVLLRYGYAVSNPMENGLPADATTREHLRADFRMLLDCDAMVFLEGWERSAGCQSEFHVGNSIGVEMFFGLSKVPMLSEPD